jgi:hypothetical protein
MVAERQLDNREMQRFITRTMSRPENIAKGQDNDAKSNVARAMEGEATMTIRVTPYVDLDTGVVVRREFALNICNRNANFSMDEIPTMYVINQLYRS